MLSNYFKIAWRNLFRHKVHTSINIIGLAVGIAACLLIFVVVHYELSYDRFQKNYDRIYRIVSDNKGRSGNENPNPGVPVPAVEAFRTDFPQFSKMAATNSIYGSQLTVLGNNPNSDVALSKKFKEELGVIFTQPAYFDIFNTTWLSGNAQSLSAPGSVILDKTTASKYFGDWSKAEGQYLKLDNTVTLKVTGVIEDAPQNSDFPIKIFVSYESFKQYPAKYDYTTDWGSLSSSHQLYVLLPENVAASGIQALMPGFVKKHYSNGGIGKVHLLQPMKEFHFDHRYGTLGEHSSSKTILWTLALIGALIIVMASINFINLSTAQAVGRSKEVGIRKVLGSNRGQLIAQVIGETFLIVLFSVLIALGIAKVMMPYLSHVADTPANLSLVNADTILFLAAVLVTVTLLSGVYPAMIVSGFKPALALKSKISSASVGGISLRRVLVVTQFAISQVLIIGTIVAVSQMNFVRNADLGFNKDAILVLPSFSDSINLARMKPLKRTLLQNPDVISVSFSSDVPSSDNNWSSNFYFDHDSKDLEFNTYQKFGDEDYFKTYGLQLVAGRTFSASDTMREVLVNETMEKKLGITDPEKMIGKTLRIGGSGSWLPIVGVVKDFKTNSLREDIKPTTIAERNNDYYTIGVKIKTTRLTQTTAQIKQLWENTYPEYTFDSQFLDESIERFYQQENQLSLLYKIFAGIAIFISCLGLYGLVSYMAVQRTREVGIRKVLGASVAHIVYLFSKEFTFLILIAFVIATPVAWYMMSNWLHNFVYRINFSIGVFAVAIIISVTIAWITVGYKAVRAALANPVKSLRSE